MNRIRLAVIGHGYWGPKLVRNLLSLSDVELVAVCDIDAGKLEAVRGQGITTYTDFATMLKEQSLDAVAIATPVSTHHALAKQALEAGLHVLVEKPLADSAVHAKELIDLAAQKNRTLMVDHTFVYTGAVRLIRQLIDAGSIGDIQYYDSVRVNLGIFQHDVNVLWDLAVHDLSILLHLLQKRPTHVAATAIRHFDHQPENIAYLTLLFDDNLIGHIHVNWMSPVKVRRTLIGGTRSLVVYDDLEPTEKVKLYERQSPDKQPTETDIHTWLADYRTGEIRVPPVDITEALQLLCMEFVRSIRLGEPPLTDGQKGLEVVEILEAAMRSLANDGARVAL